MSACASIACDHCPRPGACCTGFALYKPSGPLASPDVTMLEALVELATVEVRRADDALTIGLPFMPLDIVERDGVRWWRYWCPLLTKDGRCGDYENRPALCSDFMPGSNGLCVLHKKPAPTPDDLLKAAEASLIDAARQASGSV